MRGWQAVQRGLCLVAVGAMVLAAGCSDDDPPAAEASTSTTTTSTTPGTGPGACDGGSAAPVVLEDAPGQATVVDVVARGSGQLVAVGSRLWIRDPDASGWQATDSPGAPDYLPTAVAEADGEVWLATNDATGQEGPNRSYRSADLVTWEEVPFLLDGAPVTTTINALVREGDGWLALAQDADTARLISSPDGQAWTTVTSIPLQREALDAVSLFDLGVLDSVPTSVGFTVGSALQPLVVGWQADGTVTERVSEDLADVRLWGVVTLGDGRVVVATDEIVRPPGAEPVGFGLVLRELLASGELETLLTPAVTRAFEVPADLVAVADDEVVVVGFAGDTRQTLVPVAWTLCLP